MRANLKMVTVLTHKRKKDKSYELAYYNNKEKTSYTAIGKYYSPKGSNVKFVRDPEKLIHQYHNLIYSLGKKYSVYFSDYQERRDLFMYVKDAFVSLVYEYDIDSDVDFQGYVKRMLEKRVRESYSKREKKRRDHISPLKGSDSSITRMLDYNQSIGNNQVYLYKGEYTKDNRKKDRGDKDIEVRVGNVLQENEQDLTFFELIDYLKSSNSFDQIGLELLTLLSTGKYTPKEAKAIVLSNNPKYSIGDINSSYEKMKELVYSFIKE